MNFRADFSTQQLGAGGCTVPDIRACLNPLQRARGRAERNGAARGHSLCSCVKKRVWVHAESWASPVESARTVYYFAHMPRQIGVHVHLRWCPSTSNERISVPVRSGRSVHPKKKKGCNTSSPSSKIICRCSSRAALNLLAFRVRSASIHVANNIPFGSFQCSLGGV